MSYLKTQTSGFFVTPQQQAKNTEDFSNLKFLLFFFFCLKILNKIEPPVQEKIA